MIVVLGRPGLTSRVSAPPGDAPAPDSSRLAGLAAGIAVEAAARGAKVELAGSIGDDPEGDRVVVELGRLGVAHAALLRDPAGSTPVVGDMERSIPRLDAADVDLALRYLTDYGVLVLTEPLPADVEVAALEGAAYHSAQVIAVVPVGAVASSRLAERATVLEAPSIEVVPGDDDQPDDGSGGSMAVSAPPESVPSSMRDRADRGPFAAFVAALAARIDAGQGVSEALREAARGIGWQPLARD